MQAFVMSGWTP